MWILELLYWLAEIVFNWRLVVSLAPAVIIGGVALSFTDNPAILWPVFAVTFIPSLVFGLVWEYRASDR
jgi:hypothetical protein